MELDLLFPQVVYRAKLRDYEKFNNEIKQHIDNIVTAVPRGGENWISYVYNTCGTFEVHTDERFKELTKLISKHVSWFARKLSVDNSDSFSPKQSWLNVYESHEFQEFHYHAGFTFSAVYYVQTTPNTSIIFENPFTDMLPLKLNCVSDLNNNLKKYYPTDGDLLIFRSHLKHSVPPHNDEGKRITLALNF